MNKIFQKLTLLLSVSALMISCDMEQFPHDRIATSAAWEKITDAERFRNGIYDMFRGYNGGGYTYSADYQSDLFNATISFGNRGGDMYRWDFTSSQENIENIWAGNYDVINNCNNIINNIDKIAIADDAEKATQSMIKGEAYLMRAICYHTLVLRFAKDYEPGTTELGLPIMLNVDVEAKPERSSLEKTYEQIKNDIQEARTYLTTEGAANSEYFTTDVIDAFEARVNLYMHKYSEAVSLANPIIAKYPLIDSTDAFEGFWLNDEGSELIYRTSSSVDERSNSYGVYIAYTTASSSYQPDFIPSQWVLDLYEDSDIRKSVYFFNAGGTFNDLKEDVTMLKKYPGNPALKTADHQYYQKHKIFRSAEAYLIAAEASYQDGKEDDARNYLNSLRTTRGASEITASGDALWGEIKNEWIREYVGEGQRLNDLKRWHDGFQRRDPQSQNIILVSDKTTDLKIDGSDIRFIWEIPVNDLKANTNIVPNW